MMDIGIFILLLDVFTTTAQTPDTYQKYLRPGVLLKEEGNILLVEDVLNIKIPYLDITNIPQKMAEVQDQLTSIQNTLKNTTEEDFILKTEHMLSYRKLLQIRIEHINMTLLEICSNLPVEFNSYSLHRSKRGLFNLGGSILGQVFGLATEEDMNKLKNHVNSFIKVINNQNKFMTQHSKIIKDIHITQNKIIKQMNYITESFNSIIKFNAFILKIYLVIDQHVSILSSLLSQMKSSIQIFHKMLYYSLLNQVTTDILPTSQLLKCIKWARSHFNLIPIFSENNLEYYYPLLEVTVTPTELLIHIPFQSNEIFSTYSFQRFPTKINNSFYTIKAGDEIFLISQDYSHMAKVNNNIFSKCHSSFLHLHLCPAYYFTIFPSERLPCELAIINNNTQSIYHTCKYEQITYDDVFHVHYHPWYFFYFTNKTSITLSCPDTKTEVHHVIGSYIVLDTCYVNSISVSAFPNRHHKGFLINSTKTLIELPSFSNVIANNITFTSNKIEVLSYINETYPELGNIVANSIEEIPFFENYNITVPIYYASAVVFLFMLVIFFINFLILRAKLAKILHVIKNLQSEHIELHTDT